MSNNTYKILLVEDDENVRSVTATMLEMAGYKAIEAASCSIAKTLFLSHKPDAVILDLGLPDEDGMHFIEFARASALTPIIVLSARDTEGDKVTALDSGANDYVTKPFSAAELLARIRTALRTYNTPQGENIQDGKFKTRDLVIDYAARQLFVGDKEIKLSQTEYNIVAFLSRNCGKMMSYSAIIKDVWGYDDEGGTKKLQVNMTNIRKKLGVKPGEARYITNELGVGYRMDCEK